MHAPLPLIATLAIGLSLALLFGLLAQRLRLPPLVGYLLAGVLIGPHTPGFVGDAAIAHQFAEIGVMLLMFGVGLHFSWKDLLAVRGTAVPGALLQMAVATALGALLAHGFGVGWGGALVFGLSLSVASTVVLLRALEDRHELQTAPGRLAVGWLVVEDLAMVIALVLLPVLAPFLGGSGPTVNEEVGWVLLRTVGAVLGFAVLMLVVGPRVLPWLLWQVSRTGSRELFTLAIIVAAIGLAFGAAMGFGISFALGAFLAGMVLRESPFSFRAAEESLPLRDAFAVLFFVSVGMLFDPRVLLADPLPLLAVLAVVLGAKSLAAALLVLARGLPLRTALLVAASLAQIGEFSFILVALGGQLNLLDARTQSWVVAAALGSIALNPALFAAVEPLERWLCRRFAWARQAALREDALAALPDELATPQAPVLLVGLGPVGQRLAGSLRGLGHAVIGIDSEAERVQTLRDAGGLAVCGDARDPRVLVQAHLHRARLLVFTLDDLPLARQVADLARQLRPDLPLLMRADTNEEAERTANEQGVRALGPAEAWAAALLERARQNLD
ncbi:cation:proton antiporter [Inhella sp.]|uniref:cation:proton antiporter n=1 Tax=Inhella sp. TaxID=1921806 RepID=UPI0035B17289